MGVPIKLENFEHPSVIGIGKRFNKSDQQRQWILTHDLEGEGVVQWPVSVLAHHNVVRLTAYRCTVLEAGCGENHLTDGLECAVVLEVLQKIRVETKKKYCG